ncbi:MAG: heme o synthase [Candidatus Eisenbacteria bacterium]|uniref:Protoheme IX farnesyltransferase n=1 Tax=Eiseniibacteriota bacterium TaxID=2212470 RepID=A0A956N8T9_UNCEI|nr:heme o synthase [Candidatus Eisenbacteria bacterium]MCB9464914.1 protoheme IX farnesyltransferase [Candidatus Eisenbacteria bacterium]
MARSAHSPVHTIALLTKARLGLLVTLTTVVGFIVASVGDIHWTRLLITAIGTTMAAFGANAFNQCIERSRDARMERTKGRPLPAGTLTIGQAVAISGLLAAGGDIILAVFVNPLTAGLALIIQVLYLFVYTPLKPRTPANTLVGAVCGAIPPMMGWTAVRGQIDPGAWILFLILFVWQMPHFLSLAWLYREDYERGGFRMLPSLDPTGMLTCNLVVLYTAALLPLAFATTIAGIAGWKFFTGALVLGIVWIGLAVQLRTSRETRHARRVFFASLIYLPLFLALLVLDRGPAVSPGPSFRLGENVKIPQSASLEMTFDVEHGMDAGRFGAVSDTSSTSDALRPPSGN